MFNLNRYIFFTFNDAVMTCLHKYADFSGRARRSEYWYFVVFNMVVQAGLNALGRLVFGADSNLAPVFASIYALAVFIPTLAVTWRRLHDVGKSGAYWFFMLLPLVGWIIVLIQLCKDSDPGENQYGVSPKYPNKYYR